MAMRLSKTPTFLQGGRQQGVKVEAKLGPDPLVAALPARAVQEDVLAVLHHVLQQVVGEAQVGRGQGQQPPQPSVLDVDTGLLHLSTQSETQTVRNKHTVRNTHTCLPGRFPNCQRRRAMHYT